MKRRHRRVLFNVFAYSLLATALYLNMFRMYDEIPSPSIIASKNVKAGSSFKTGDLGTLTHKEIRKSH